MLNVEEQAGELRSLEQNLNIYKESIREIADEILDNNVSKYPVFIASREEVNLGRLVIDKEDLALDWSIYASTLEEFVRRGIVKQDRLDLFRKNYKNPREFICLFSILEDNAGFIFLPYDS